MEAAAYRRLLLRLLAIPVVALALLAGLMAYGFDQVQRSARRVDRADQIIAQASKLLRLIIDQETGLRGFLLTHDPQLLQPYREADFQIEPQFASLFHEVRNDPGQTARLKTLYTQCKQWQQMAQHEIDRPVLPSYLAAAMLERKRRMDNMRAKADEFIAAESVIRADRSSASLRLHTLSLSLLMALAALIAVVLAWNMYRLVTQLTQVYTRQLDHVRRREQESYVREQWLHTMLRSIGDAVIACDPAGNVVFMNKVAEQLTGWQESEGKGRLLSEIFSIINQRTRAVEESPVDKVRRLGTVVGLANHTVLISKDKQEFYVSDSAAPILDENACMIGIVLVFRDVTERYAAERALVRTEKLASAGRLAAAIAHEVNNPLEGLVNLIYLARQEDNIENVRRHLDQADRELQRIAHITRQTLGFYRENALAAFFRPDKVAREVTEFYSFRALQAHVGMHVKILTEQSVFGNAGELRQVLSNLLTNSLDACKAGSSICVRVYAANDTTGVAGVRVVVADTGPGIPRKNLQSVFEPFFTTKKETGTGLGLWVSRELVEKQGGHLRMRSSDTGRRTGTVFSIFLPSAPRASQPA